METEADPLWLPVRGRVEVVFGALCGQLSVFLSFGEITLQGQLSSCGPDVETQLATKEVSVWDILPLPLLKTNGSRATGGSAGRGWIRSLPEMGGALVLKTIPTL
jgi:hypothetical protein